MTEQSEQTQESTQDTAEEQAPTRISRQTRIAVAVAATVVLAGAAVGYIQLRGEGSSNEVHAAPETTGTVSLAPGPRLLELKSNGQLTSVAKDNPSGPRTVTDLKCARVYAAAGTGACLHADGVLGTVELQVLDQDLHQQKTIPVTGLPNRLRVSPTGRMVSWTLFVDGDGYDTLDFSTRTGIYDTRTGEELDSMEKFTVIKDGRPFQGADVNFWGVTFTPDDNKFYATMYTGGRRYLVEGDFAAKTVRTLKERVECPSLSPDGTRVAFKEAVDPDHPKKGWRLSVLDLAALHVTPLAETRSVDDQAAWLDNSTAGYALQRGDGTKDLWSVPADGSGKPALLTTDASSPVALG